LASFKKDKIRFLDSINCDEFFD